MNAVDVVIGALELVVALLVLTASTRSRHARWLAALSLFFALRGVDRLLVGVLDRRSAWAGALVDAALAIVLLLLVFVLRNVLWRIEHMFDAADEREREYRRALLDYRRVARHRLATPVTAIVGSAQALRDMPELDHSTRDRLLATLVSEAERLKDVVLEPDGPLAPEERGLRPSPRLQPDQAEQRPAPS